VRAVFWYFVSRITADWIVVQIQDGQGAVSQSGQWAVRFIFRESPTIFDPQKSTE
jgi:hypothetical protein